MIHLLPILCFPRSLSTKPLLCLFPNIAIRYEQSVSIVLCDTNTGTLRSPARCRPCLSSMTPAAAPSTEEPLCPVTRPHRSCKQTGTAQMGLHGATSRCRTLVQSPAENPGLLRGIAGETRRRLRISGTGDDARER